MSADCLVFCSSKSNKKFEVVDDDTSFFFDDKKTALNFLKSICKSHKFNINYENLNFFYKNYSTGYIMFKYIDDNVIQEIKN